MKRGTKIRTTYEHSQTGVIIGPAKHMPAGWWRVRFDDSGGVMCIHADMLVIRNSQ